MEPNRMDRLWQFVGPLLTLGVVLAVELLSRTMFSIPNPPAIILLVVIFTTFSGGLRAGLTSAVITWLYVVYYFSIPDQPFHYIDENFRRVVVWAVTIPAMATLVAVLKQRTVRQAAERERLLAQLEEERERLDAIIRNTSDGVLLLNEQREVIGMNPAMEVLSGWAAVEVKGKNCWEVFRSHDRNGVSVCETACPMLRAMGGVGAVPYAEMTITMKDGETREISSSYAYIRLHNRGPGYGVAIARDISMAKGVEKLLEGRVQERTSELTRVNEELRIEIAERKLAEERLLRAQRLEMAGSVAAQVAHDFNNLLTPFMSYPELIKMDLPEGHPAIGLCNSMLMAAQQMAEINEDLLTLSRRGYFNQEPTDLNLLIEQAIAQLTAWPATLRIGLDLAPDLLLVKSSGAQLLRVISNLISNAREAVEDKGLLTLKTESVYVSKPFGRYSRVEVGEYARFQITDTGHGIPDEIRSRIFDPFFTTKHADRRRGSGLGLSVVQAIVEDHGGYVDVTSEVENGSTFSVYFPAFRGTLEEQPMEEIKAGSEAILVVDDDDLQREVVKKLLESKGYKVNTASSGEAALAYVKEHAVDLLLLDMTMPGGMDGAETYRQILELRPDQKAIIISGYAETDRVQQTKALGAGIYLRKPISLQKLTQAVREELERQRIKQK